MAPGGPSFGLPDSGTPHMWILKSMQCMHVDQIIQIHHSSTVYEMWQSKINHNSTHAIIKFNNSGDTRMNHSYARWYPSSLPQITSCVAFRIQEGSIGQHDPLILHVLDQLHPLFSRAELFQKSLPSQATIWHMSLKVQVIDQRGGGGGRGEWLIFTNSSNVRIFYE